MEVKFLGVDNLVLHYIFRLKKNWLIKGRSFARITFFSSVLLSDVPFFSCQQNTQSLGP